METGKFEAVEEFTLTLPPEWTPGGGWLFKGRRKVRPGDVIEITKAYVEGYGSDAVPEQEAKLSDGTVGRIGRGVTAGGGYLRPVERDAHGASR
jgi:hypothetical protein